MDDQFPAGAIVVDKPAGWTSHDVVAKLRRLAKTKKVGHLGTLDPMATGVLPLLMGRATRLAQFFGQNEKCYLADVTFGFSTHTYDAEGTPTSDVTAVSLDRETVDNALSEFRGSYLQMPPPVSAKKIGGKAAYQLVREGKEVDLRAVPVTVEELELESLTENRISLRVRCSAGTYVRSIAHELGQKLGCGAHLSRLVRTQSGQFGLDQANSIERLTELAEAGNIRESLIPTGGLLPSYPRQIVDRVTAAKIQNGQNFHVSPFRTQTGTRYLAAVTESGDLLAIGEAVLPHVYHPICVL